MKRKEFLEHRMRYFKALTKHKDKKAQELKQELLQAIFDRKAKGKSVKNLNYH